MMSTPCAQKNLLSTAFLGMEGEEGEEGEEEEVVRGMRGLGTTPSSKIYWHNRFMHVCPCWGNSSLFLFFTHHAFVTGAGCAPCLGFRV